MESGDVVIDDVVAFHHPVLFAGEIYRVVDGGWVVVGIDVTGRSGGVSVGRGSLGVPPASGLGHDGLVDPVGESEVSVYGSLFTQSPFVEEVLLYAVRKEHAEFSVSTQSLEGCACPTGAAVAVPGELIEDDLLIPAPEAVFAIAAPNIGGGVTIVVRPVLRIRIKVEEHVIREVNDIEVILDGVVDPVVRNVAVGDTHHPVPAGSAPTEILVDFPVLLRAAEVFGPEVVLEALSEVMEAEVKPVDVEMDEVSVA